MGARSKEAKDLINIIGKKYLIQKLSLAIQKVNVCSIGMGIR